MPPDWGVCLAAWSPDSGPAACQSWGDSAQPLTVQRRKQGAGVLSQVIQLVAELKVEPGLGTSTQLSLCAPQAASWSCPDSLHGLAQCPMCLVGQSSRQVAVGVCEMGGVTKGTSSSHRGSGNFALPLFGLFLHTSWGQGFVNKEEIAIQGSP